MNISIDNTSGTIVIAPRITEVQNLLRETCIKVRIYFLSLINSSV